MTKPWVVGFIEAEGSFYLVSKDPTRIVFNVEFSISQNSDELLLHAIKRLFRIPNKIEIKKNGFWTLTTKNYRAISNIIKIFSTGGLKFKGMKSLEFKL